MILKGERKEEKRQKKRNNDTNIPRKPASVTNTNQGEEGMENEKSALQMTPATQNNTDQRQQAVTLNPMNRAQGKQKFIKHKEQRNPRYAPLG